MRKGMLLIGLTIFLPGCAPPVRIPADAEVNRIEITDQELIRTSRDLLHPRTITNPEKISAVLSFLRPRQNRWSPPLFETPGGRYTVGFHKDDKFQFVLWLIGDGLCGRNDDEDMHDNRCRSLTTAEMEELGQLLEIEFPYD